MEWDNSIKITQTTSIIDQSPISKEDLAKTLRAHREWLADRTKGKRADFFKKNLFGVDLDGQNLSYADFYGANLINAKLSNTNLSFCNLCGAILDHADLSGAIMHHAYMSDTRLYNADLSSCDLRFASFSRAEANKSNFTKSNLQCANLYKAKLCNCDFADSILKFSNLSGANVDGSSFRNSILIRAMLSYAENTKYADFSNAKIRTADFSTCQLDRNNILNLQGLNTVLNLRCPEEGSFIAWQCCRNQSIAKLLIPKDAQRTGSSVNTCRASKAKVLKIFCSENDEIEPYESKFPVYDRYGILYSMGETITVDDYDGYPYADGKGIHFYLSKAEALFQRIYWFDEEQDYSVDYDCDYPDDID